MLLEKKQCTESKIKYNFAHFHFSIAQNQSFKITAILDREYKRNFQFKSLSEKGQ